MKTLGDFWIRSQFILDSNNRHQECKDIHYDEQYMIDWLKLWRMVHLIEDGHKPFLKDAKVIFDITHPGYVFQQTCGFMEDKVAAQKKFSWIMDQIQQRRCTCGEASDRWTKFMSKIVTNRGT